MFGDHDLLDFSDIWSQAIDGSGTGIWDRNVVTGEIRYSRSWFAILGYEGTPRSNRIEESYARVHPDDLADVQARIQSHFDGRTSIYEVEHRLRCKSGAYKWVLSRGKVIARDDAGRPLRMVGTTTDVTTTRELAEQLKIQHARAQETAARLTALSRELIRKGNDLAAAHRLAAIVTWRWDLGTRCLWFSPEFWRMMGRAPCDAAVSYEEARGMFHPDDHARAMARFNDAVKTKTPVILEYRIVCADGAVLRVLTHAEPVFDPGGGVVQLRGTTQDITRYRQIEEALRESEDHHRHMVELHPQIPWIAGPDGDVLGVGPQWLAITGMTREEALPNGWIEAVFIDDREPTIAAWKHCLATGEPLDIEYRLRLADGSHGWFRARAAARFGADGRIVRWYGTLENVSDRRAAEAAQRASEALAFRVLEATSDAVLVCDHNWRITFANTRAAIKIGSDQPLAGANAAELFDTSHGRTMRNAIANAIDSLQGARFEMYWPPTDLWFEISVYVDANEVSLFMHDITESHAAQQQLRYAASHDLMTGAVTRETQFARVAAQLALQGPGNLVALLYLDLDYFKEINDTFGHPMGNSLLVQVVNRLHACLRSQDVLARGGGDEFIIMMTGVRKPADATALAERIIAAMRLPFEIEEHVFGCSTSIGIAVSTLASNARDLYQQADLALYEAKRKARGSFQMFRPAMQAAFEAKRNLRAGLLLAVERNELSLAFQPIVQISARRIVGVEALLRWQHPEHGAVSPAEFIPIAEASDLINDIGAWVLRQACEAAREWPEAVKVSVNVSPRQFELDNVGRVVREALRASGLPACRLKLEMTESVLFGRNAANIRTLQELRELGVTLVLDDFGVGYSSLSYLSAFKFDFIKVDKLFVADIREPGDRQPVFEAIMGMAAALQLPVTAEGVETDVQLDYVSRLGCDFAQGYLFGAPMARDAMRDLLARETAGAGGAGRSGG